MARRKPKPTAVKKLEGNPGKRKMNTKKQEMPACLEWCKCQYKNVGFISYKRVGKPTCLYDIF